MATFDSVLSKIIREVDTLKTEARSLRTSVVHAPLNMGATKISTISGGIIEVARPHVSVIPESGTADTLNFIDATTSLDGYDGKIIVVSAYRSGDTITVNHHTVAAGNISLQFGSTLDLTTQGDSLMLMYKATTDLWEQIGGGGSGGGGAVDSVNGQTGVVVLDTDDIAQGVTNLYLTAPNFATTLIAQAGKSAIVGGDIFAILDSEDSYQVKEFSWSDAVTNMMAEVGFYISGLTGKTPPVGADGIVISDSAAGGAPKLLTFTNLGTYLTGLYMDLTTNQTAAGHKIFSDSVTSPTVRASAATNPAIRIEGTGINLSADQQTAFGVGEDEAAVISVANNSTGGSWWKSVSDGAASAIGSYWTHYGQNDLTTFASFEFVAAKHNGSGALTAHGATARIWALYNHTTNLITALGNGNVGIGKIPGAKLDVAGSARFVATNTLPSADGAGAALETWYYSTGGYGLILSYNRDTSGYLPIRIAGSQIFLQEGATTALAIDDLLVGVGTETPGQNLVGTFDMTSSTYRIIHIDHSDQARMVVRGGVNAALDLIDYGGNTNEKWLVFQLNSGAASILSLTDAVAAHLTFLKFDMSNGRVGVNMTGTVLTPFQVRVGTNQNFGILSSTDTSISAFNDAGSANVPLRFHATKHTHVSGTGKRAFLTLTGISGTAVVLVAAADGAASYAAGRAIIIPASGAMQSANIDVSAATSTQIIYSSGGNQVTFRINGDGSIDVRRTAGAAITYTILFDFLWV